MMFPFATKTGPYQGVIGRTSHGNLNIHFPHLSKENSNKNQIRLVLFPTHMCGKTDSQKIKLHKYNIA